MERYIGIDRCFNNVQGRILQGRGGEVCPSTFNYKIVGKVENTDW